VLLLKKEKRSLKANDKKIDFLEDLSVMISVNQWLKILRFVFFYFIGG